MALWSAVIAEARTCYETQNGAEWRQLEAQMEQRADQDEEYWKDAAYDARYCESMNFIGEKQRLAASKKQIEVFRRVAVDGKSGRLEAERHATEWTAGATDRARDRRGGMRR